MAETKHSPLPYRADEPIRMDELWFSFLFDADNNIVARIEGRTEDECNANAALVVQAVNNHEKLVEALKQIKARFEGLITDNDDDERLNNIRRIAHQPFYDIIDQALADIGRGE